MWDRFQAKCQSLAPDPDHDVELRIWKAMEALKRGDTIDTETDGERIMLMRTESVLRRIFDGVLNELGKTGMKRYCVKRMRKIFTSLIYDPCGCCARSREVKQMLLDRLGVGKSKMWRYG